MLSSTLLTTLLLALAVSANPIVVKKSLVTLPLSRRVNHEGLQNLVRRDQERARSLKARADTKGAGLGHSVHPRAVISSPISDHTVSYVATVGIGNPAKNYELLVDSGSANTWIGANQAYTKTSTSVQTSNNVTVANLFSGIEFLDQVAIASGLVIPQQSIGVATTVSGSSNLQGIDGYLGIGPEDLSRGTLSPDTQATIPTVTDNLFSNGAITGNEVAISFVPSTSTNQDANGEITWGGTDSQKFTGSITFVPITSTHPANEYWGIDMAIRYGSSTTIMPKSAGIVDTGTTLILLATPAFQAYQQATGGVVDSNTSLLTITADQFSNLQSLFFQIGDTNFEFTPNAQIWPRSLNTAIGGVAGNIYLIIADSKANSGQGLDFTIGFTFLQRFYTVFDTANKRVGFATTPHTQDTTN